MFYILRSIGDTVYIHTGKKKNHGAYFMDLTDFANCPNDVIYSKSQSWIMCCILYL